MWIRRQRVRQHRTRQIYSWLDNSINALKTRYPAMAFVLKKKRQSLTRAWQSSTYPPRTAPIFLFLWMTTGGLPSTFRRGLADEKNRRVDNCETRAGRVIVYIYLVVVEWWKNENKRFQVVAKEWEPWLGNYGFANPTPRSRDVHV